MGHSTAPFLRSRRCLQSECPDHVRWVATAAAPPDSEASLQVTFDGQHGLLGCSTERLMKTMWASIHLLRQRGGTKKEMQAVLGRWIFVLQFRRAAMGILPRSWEAVERCWRRPELTNALLAKGSTNADVPGAFATDGLATAQHLLILRRQYPC